MRKDPVCHMPVSTSLIQFWAVEWSVSTNLVSSSYIESSRLNPCLCFSLNLLHISLNRSSDSLTLYWFCYPHQPINYCYYATLMKLVISYSIVRISTGRTKRKQRKLESAIKCCGNVYKHFNKFSEALIATCFVVGVPSEVDNINKLCLRVHPFAMSIRVFVLFRT